MNSGIAAALVLALPVGLSLGALGAGGSILILPLLVFIAGIGPREAIAISLVAVGGTSLLGAGFHYWRGHFHLKAAILFAASGIVTSYFGSYLTHMVSPRALLGIFAALMLAAGVGMVSRQPSSDGKQRCGVARCLIIGALVGVVTGFLGIGGGFMILPALVLFAGIPTKDAVGTSLAIIALNGAGGFIGQAQQISIDWRLAFGFLGVAILGMLGGLGVAEKVSSQTLKKAFGWFVIALAVVVGAMSAAGIAMPAK